MRATAQTLQETLHSPNQYVIPIFQRYYSWGTDNWRQLWESISELQSADLLNKCHFMGSLVFVAEKHFPDTVPTYQVIDGQQRLMTISLLLCALRNVAREQGFSELAAEINENYLLHRFKKHREHYRVYPRLRDRVQYLAVIEHQGVANGRISEALKYFLDQVKSIPNANTEDALRALFDIVQTRLEFVQIVLDGENPYRIFKSLNSTGLDLSEGDLIRNFVFMHVAQAQQDEFDDTFWRPLEKHFENSQGNLNGSLMSGFFRDFLMQEGKYIGLDATFETFEHRYANSNFEPTDLARSLSRSVQLYDFIRGVASHSLISIDSSLSQLRDLDSSTTHPLILNLLLKLEDGLISSQDFNCATNLVASFILRRYVCGESSRAYGRWFVAACIALGNTPLEGLRLFLKSKGYPDDARFITALIHFNLYESNYGLALLKTLEKSVLHKEPADLSQVQIEHIMPQSLTAEWKADLGPEAERVYSECLHTIGNLTLSAYNPTLSNKTFVDKRKEYEKSNVILTRDISKLEIWTEAEILERGQRLSEAAARIWLGPDAQAL